MEIRRFWLLFVVVLFLSAIFAVNWQAERTEFWFLAVFYTLSFIAYLLIVVNRSRFSFKHFMWIALGAHFISILFVPYLSDDYFRFLWDGEMTWAGINPYDFKPNELVMLDLVQSNPYLVEVYEGISSLSKRNHTCYPPINQAYFMLSTAFSDSIIGNTIILKLSIILTQIAGAFYLRKILRLLHIDESRMWLIYLNPLWIIECTGNTHFEGVMLSFLFAAFYFLVKKKELIGSLFYAIAIHIKLIPLMLLPFFYRFLGLKKSMLFYSLTILIVISLGLVPLNSNNILNFKESLSLYFSVFEFNSFIVHYCIQFGIAEYGWQIAKTYGLFFSQVIIMLVMTLALYGQIPDWKKLFKRMTLAFFVYLILSNTIHPWYIIPLIGISLFTTYSFPIIWSFLIFFTYLFYLYNDGGATQVRMFINLEYLIVFAIFVYETVRKRAIIINLGLENFILKGS